MGNGASGTAADRQAVTQAVIAFPTDDNAADVFVDEGTMKTKSKPIWHVQFQTSA